MSDLSHLEPASTPTPERIEYAADLVTRLREVGKALDGWQVTFRRDDLECTGVWPIADLRLSEFEVPIDAFTLDNVEPSACYERHLERARLAVPPGDRASGPGAAADARRR